MSDSGGRRSATRSISATSTTSTNNNNGRRRSRYSCPYRRDAALPDVLVSEGIQFLGNNNSEIPLHDLMVQNSNSSGTSKRIKTVEEVGQGCYISAVVQNQKLYGILLEQRVLSAANEEFLEEQAERLSLDLQVKEDYELNSRANYFVPEVSIRSAAIPSTVPDRHVMQFRYNPVNNCAEWVATFKDCYYAALSTVSSITQHNNNEKKTNNLDCVISKIRELCESGGGHYIDGFYYKFVRESNALLAEHYHDTAESREANQQKQYVVHNSIGIHSFLAQTALPGWFPMQNLASSKNAQLRLKELVASKTTSKRRKTLRPISDSPSQNIVTATSTKVQVQASILTKQTVVICGAGIAGLSCAKFLLEKSKANNLNIHVILLEGRDRIGGRIAADKSTLGDENNKFAVDLGSQVFSGDINESLQKYLTDTRTALNILPQDGVAMMREGQELVDSREDALVSSLFLRILDAGLNTVKKYEDDYKSSSDNEVIRWYAGKRRNENGKDILCSQSSVTPSHRSSCDIPVDDALYNGMQSLGRSLDDIQQKNLLIWMISNEVSAHGADLGNLSSKYYSCDVFRDDNKIETRSILPSTFVSVTESLLSDCQSHENFELVLEQPVKKISYGARNNSCKVETKNRTFDCEYAVCTLPLGVLKNSVASEASTDDLKVEFEPKLPDYKVDAINNMGFGLVNRYYLEFSTAFWRESRDSVLAGDYVALEEHGFGCLLKKGRGFYAFWDVGKMYRPDLQNDAPPVLMGILAGSNAIEAENTKDKKMIKRIMSVLASIFTQVEVPEPSSFVSTKWGSDPFSRGSFSFIPVGAREDDLHTLGRPTKGNDAYRLFWAGEHTSVEHYSTVHGAFSSGEGAANDIIQVLLKGPAVFDHDEFISLSHLRLERRGQEMKCEVCKQVGDKSVEGKLLGSRKGSRFAIAHENCVFYSHDVLVDEDANTLEGIIQTVENGKVHRCQKCDLLGATILCVPSDGSLCQHHYHYKCALETGWKFASALDNPFHCPLHRSTTTSTTSVVIPPQEMKSSEYGDQRENENNKNSNDPMDEDTVVSAHSDSLTNNTAVNHPFTFDPLSLDMQIRDEYSPAFHEIRAIRKSGGSFNIGFVRTIGEHATTLKVLVEKGSSQWGFQDNDIVLRIHGVKDGNLDGCWWTLGRGPSDNCLLTMEDVREVLTASTEAKFTVIRKR